MSVVVPCYNYAQYLSSCLTSVLSQVGVQIDVTIVDDTSTDGSLEIAHEWALRDPRIRVIEHKENLGHIATFNEALSAATAPYVVKMDPDDLLSEDALQRAAEVLSRHTDAAFVYGKALRFVGEPPVVRPQHTRSATIWQGADWIMRRARFGHNLISQPEVMIRREALLAVGGHDPGVPDASDFNLWLRLASWGSVIRLNGAIQGLYRVHAASMQRTIHAGQLPGLRARIKAFELYTDQTTRLANTEVVRTRYRRTFADDALRIALEAYDAGLQDAEPIDEYVRMARELDPTVVRRRQWRELERVRDSGSIGTSHARRLQRRIRWDHRLQWLRS